MINWELMATIGFIYLVLGVLVGAVLTIGFCLDDMDNISLENVVAAICYFIVMVILWLPSMIVSISKP